MCLGEEPIGKRNVKTNKTVKAVGIVANEEGGVSVISKTKSANKPAAGRTISNQGANKSARK